MSNKFVILLIILIIALVVGFLWLVPFGDPEQEILENKAAREFQAPDLISVDHFFADGVHTYDGTIEVPTPCHSIDHSVDVSEDGSTAQINFSIKSSDDLCTQVLTSKIFSVSFEANEDAFVSATIDGKDVVLDVKEGEESAIQKL